MAVEDDEDGYELQMGMYSHDLEYLKCEMDSGLGVIMGMGCARPLENQVYYVWMWCQGSFN